MQTYAKIRILFTRVANFEVSRERSATVSNVETKGVLYYRRLAPSPRRNRAKRVTFDALISFTAEILSTGSSFLRGSLCNTIPFDAGPLI